MKKFYGIKNHIYFREGKAKILKYLGMYYSPYTLSYDYGGKGAEKLYLYGQGSNSYPERNLAFSSTIKNHIFKPKSKKGVLAKPVNSYEGISYRCTFQTSVKAHKFRKANKKPVVPYVDLEMIE